MVQAALDGFMGQLSKHFFFFVFISHSRTDIYHPRSKDLFSSWCLGQVCVHYLALRHVPPLPRGYGTLCFHSLRHFCLGTALPWHTGSPLAWNATLPASGLASSGASLGSNWVFTPYIVPTMTGCTRLALIIEDNFGPFGQHHLSLALSLAGARTSLLKATPRLKLVFLLSFVLFSSYSFPFFFETII